MPQSSKKFLKNSKSKIMIVDESFANEVNALSKKMQTSPKDVIAAALELLKLSLSREVTIRKPNSDIELRLPMFKSLDPEIKINGEE